MKAISIVTLAGIKLTADLLNEGEKLEFTKISVGNGAYSTDPQEMAELSNELYALQAFNISRDGNRLKISGILPESTVYPVTITEFGLWAKNNHPTSESDENILYGVAPEYARPRLFYGEYDSGVFELYFEISNALEIEIKIPFTGYITIDDAENSFAPAAHRHPATQIDESTGETTEQVQRRQDAKINLMFQTVGGLNLVMAFEDNEMEYYNIVRGIVVDESLLSGGSF